QGGGDTLNLRLVNANPVPNVIGQGPLATTSNYFVGSDPSQWQTGVTNYGRIAYQNVYAGTDLVYYGNQRQLEYDFTVAPGADPGQVAFRVDGSQGLSLDAQGNLLIHTRGADVVEHAPILSEGVGGGGEGGVRSEEEGAAASSL